MYNIQKQTKTITEKRQNKVEKLLTNLDVKRWFDNVARGSRQTAEVRCRRVGEFCESHEITPMEFADIGRKNSLDAADLLQDHVSWMEQDGKSPGYIDSTLTALKSWLSHFDIKISRKIRVANSDATPTLENERVPEGEELTELFNRAELRTGAIMSLICKSGVRPQVIGNHDATDGLMIKDLPDLAIVQGRATFTAFPPRIIVRKTISKARHEYFTFITPLGTKKLLAYLNQRILDGESFAPNSPVITPDKNYRVWRKKNQGKPFLETRTVSKLIRDAMRPRFTWRPYVLRAFFDTQLLIAESRGKIAHDFRVFFMGHKGSMEAKYTTNKSILPQALIREMRDAYVRSSEFLDLENSKESEEEQKSKEELKSSIDSLTPEQVSELLGKIHNGKANNGSSIQTMQSHTSQTAGSTSEHCQIKRLSSNKQPETKFNEDSTFTVRHDSHRRPHPV